MEKSSPVLSVVSWAMRYRRRHQRGDRCIGSGRGCEGREWGGDSVLGSEPTAGKVRCSLCLDWHGTSATMERSGGGAVEVSNGVSIGGFEPRTRDTPGGVRKGIPTPKLEARSRGFASSSVVNGYLGNPHVYRCDGLFEGARPPVSRFRWRPCKLRPARGKGT